MNISRTSKQGTLDRFSRRTRARCSSNPIQGKSTAQAIPMVLDVCKCPWESLNQPSVWEGTESEALSESSLLRELSPTWKVMLLSDGSVTRHLQLLTGSQVHVECLEMANIGSSIQGLPPLVEHVPATPHRVQRTVLLSAPDPALQHNTRSTQSTETSTSPTIPESSDNRQQPTTAYSSLGNESPPTTSTTSDTPATRQPHSKHGAAGTGSTSGGSPPPLVYAVSWWDSGEVDQYLVDRSQPIWVSLSQGKVELHRKILNVSCGHNEALEKLLGCPGPFWGRQYLFTHDGGKPLTLIYEVFSPHLQRYLGPMYTS